jgi:hypothetical protein
MSEEEEDEHREYVRRSSSPSSEGTATVVYPQQTVPAQAPATVVTTTRPPVEHKEVIERHRTTNIGAVIAIFIGVVVLVAGMALIYSQIHFLPWPYSVIVVLGFGLILLAIGASLITTRTSTT